MIILSPGPVTASAVTKAMPRDDSQNEPELFALTAKLHRRLERYHQRGC